MGVVPRIVDKLGVARKDQPFGQVRVLGKLGSQCAVHNAFPHVVPICAQRQARVSSQLNRAPGSRRTPDDLLEVKLRKLLGLKIMLNGGPGTVIQLDRVIGRIAKHAVKTRDVVPEKDSLHLDVNNQVLRDRSTLETSGAIAEKLSPFHEDKGLKASLDNSDVRQSAQTGVLFSLNKENRTAAVSKSRNRFHAASLLAPPKTYAAFTTAFRAGA